MTKRQSEIVKLCLSTECCTELRSDNRNGYCRIHRKQLRRPKNNLSRLCEMEQCEVRLRSDCQSGYCEKHRSKSPIIISKSASYRSENRDMIVERRMARRPVTNAYMSDYYVANRERIKARTIEYHSNNPEVAREGYRRRRARRRGLLIETPKRSTVWSRTGGQCHLCLAPVEFESDWHVEHVIPLSRGGVEDIKNLAPSHAKCNLSKGSKIGSSISWIMNESWEVCIEFHLK